MTDLELAKASHAQRVRLYGELYARPMPDACGSDREVAGIAMEGGAGDFAGDVPAHGLRGGEAVPEASQGCLARAGDGKADAGEVEGTTCCCAVARKLEGEALK